MNLSELPVGAERYQLFVDHTGEEGANLVIKIAKGVIRGREGQSVWGFKGRMSTIPTEEVYLAAMEANRTPPNTFAVWDFEGQCGLFVEKLPAGMVDRGDGHFRKPKKEKA